MHHKHTALSPQNVATPKTSHIITASQRMLLDIVRPLQEKSHAPIANELSVFAVDTVGSHICEIQPLMCSGQHPEIYAQLMPILQTQYGITNIAVVLPKKDALSLHPGNSERMASIEYITVGDAPKTSDTLLLSFRVPTEKMKASYAEHYKMDTSTDESSLAFAANQHKLISRMLISAVNPRLNPAFCILDPKQTYSVETLMQQLGPTIVLKDPTQSRGVGLLVLHRPSQETFDQALKGYQDHLILAETFVKNIQEHNAEDRQTSVRYFVLFDGETQKATVFAKRNDYAERPYPSSDVGVTNKSAICHSSLASDFRFVSEFVPNEENVRLQEALGRLITVMKSTTPVELVSYIQASEHKNSLNALSGVLKDFWIHIKLTNFFANLGISNSTLETLTTKSGRHYFVEQYLELCSNIGADINSDRAKDWACLRLDILAVARAFLSKEAVRKLVSVFRDYHKAGVFKIKDSDVLGIYNHLFRVLDKRQS